MACGDCISIGIPALTVTAVDSRTGQSVLAGATIIAVNGAIRDSVVVPLSYTGTSASLACCSGGTFTVIVRRAGYQDATRDNVTVATGRCGQPRTEVVDVRLTQSPAVVVRLH